MKVLLGPGGLRTQFQPLFRVSASAQSVHSFEALSRGPLGTNLASAGVLFEYARRKGREHEVDKLCIAGALREAHRVGLASLGLNVHASSLAQPSFVAWLLEQFALNGLDPARQTIEVVEHAPGWGGPRFLDAVGGLRAAGVVIALDDLGLGQSTYRMILDCAPDVFKVDRYIVTGCHADARRLAVLESLVQLAARLGAQTVAEGIESGADLAAVIAAGVTLAQGFHLAPPLDPLEAAALGARER